MTAKPSNVDALKARGMALANRGQLDAAAEIYLNILDALDGNDTDALMALGVLSGMRGDYTGAERYLQKATALNPRLASAYYNLGIAQKYQHKPEAAVSSYEQAIAIEPDNPAYHNNLGNVLLDLHAPNRAIDCFQKAVTLAPQSSDYTYNLGKALKARGLRLQAVTAFERALALRPTFDAALRALGGTYLLLGRLAEARNCYRKCLETDPSNADAIAGVANTLAHEHKHQEAFELLQSCLAAENTNTSVAIAFAAIAPQLNRQREAIRILEGQFRSDALDRDSRAQICFKLGSLLDLEGDYEKAFDYFRTGNELRGADPRTPAFDDLAPRFSRDAVASAGHSGCDSELPVFIVGMPRSGTSLVENVLASHPLVHGAGELDTLPALLNEFPALAGDIGALDRKLLATIAARYLEDIRSLAPNAARITDKMPANFQNIGYIRLLFPRARIIHCRRNPIDTCMSCYFQDFAGHLRYANDLASLGRYYLAYERLMKHWEQTADRPMHTLDYEKLVTNFEDECRKLLTFCGLEWDSRCLDFFRNRRVVVTASANQVTQPLYTGAVGRWLNYRNHLGELIAALGPLADCASSLTDDTMP